MVSEWTASRAVGKRLEDVIRKQWAVPSSHNPPTWETRERVCVCVFVCVPNLMLSVTLHSLDYEKHPLLLQSGKYFVSFLTPKPTSIYWASPEYILFKHVQTKEQALQRTLTLRGGLMFVVIVKACILLTVYRILLRFCDVHWLDNIVHILDAIYYLIFISDALYIIQNGAWLLLFQSLAWRKMLFVFWLIQKL